MRLPSRKTWIRAVPTGAVHLRSAVPESSAWTSKPGFGGGGGEGLGGGDVGEGEGGGGVGEGGVGDGGVGDGFFLKGVRTTNSPTLGAYMLALATFLPVGPVSFRTRSVTWMATAG